MHYWTRAKRTVQNDEEPACPAHFDPQQRGSEASLIAHLVLPEMPQQPPFLPVRISGDYALHPCIVVSRPYLVANQAALIDVQLP